MNLPIEENRKHTFLFNNNVSTERCDISTKLDEKYEIISKKQSLKRLKLSSSQPDMLKKNMNLGEVYRGEYLNNKKHGRGRLIFDGNKGEYEGEFKSDLFDGEGTLKTDAFTYKGGFSKGKKNGKGIYREINSTYEYEGEYLNDVKNGFGRERYVDGSVYEGTFKNGLKDGQGKLILNNGVSYYKGEFKEDKLEGFGRLFYSDSKEFAGQWKNNEIFGFGTLLDGNIRHVGYFKHDKKSGMGASFYMEEQYVLVGTWQADLCEGFAVILPLSGESTKFGGCEISGEKIIETHCGDIINMNLTSEQMSKFKKSNQYKQLLYTYNNKIYPEFLSYRK